MCMLILKVLKIQDIFKKNLKLEREKEYNDSLSL